MHEGRANHCRALDALDKFVLNGKMTPAGKDLPESGRAVGNGRGPIRVVVYS
jgi:hypothetical protein